MATKTGSETFVEDLKIHFDIDLGKGALGLEKTIRGAGTALVNVVKQYETFAKVEDAFSNSAKKTWDNRLELMGKLSKRVGKLSGNMSILNGVVQGGGAVADTLSYAWKELANSGERWFKLTKAIGPLLKLAVAFKVLKGALTILSDTFYKVGQSIADNVVAQERALEYTTILGKETGKLTHRMVVLSQVRIFAQAGKDLSAWGKLWRASSNMMSSGITVIEGAATKVINLSQSFGFVRHALEATTKAFNNFTNSVNTSVTRMTPSIKKAFDPKVFKDSEDALNHFKKNLATWAADTQMDKASLAIPMVALSRQIGDTSKAVTMLTGVMNAGFKREQVNVRELVGLMGKLGTGTALTTKTLRVMNAEIDTSSDKFLRANNVMKQMFYLMTKGDKGQTKSLFKEMSTNATVALGNLQQSLENFASASKMNLSSLWKDFGKIIDLQKRSTEEKIRQKNIGNALSQVEQRNLSTYIGLLQTQISLQQRVTGISGATETISDMQKVAAARKRLKRAELANADNYNKEEVMNAQSNLAATITSAIANDRRRIKAYVENTKHALELIKRVSLSFVDLKSAKDLKNISNAYLQTRKKSWELSKAQLAVDLQIIKATKEAGNDRSSKMIVFMSQLKAVRDEQMGALAEYVDSLSNLHKTQMNVYESLADLEGTSMRRKTKNYMLEIKQIKDIHNLSKSNIEERTRATSEWLAKISALKQEASNKINTAAENMQAFINPGERAKQRTYDSSSIAALGDIKGGKFSEFTRKILENSSSSMQAVAREITAGQVAKITETLRPMVNKIVNNAGDNYALAAQKIGGRFKNDDQKRTIALSMLAKRIHALNSSRLTGVKSIDKIQRKLLKEQKDLLDTQVATINNAKEVIGELGAFADEAKDVADTIKEESGKEKGDDPIKVFNKQLKSLMSSTDTLDLNTKSLTEAMGKLGNKMEHLKVEVDVNTGEKKIKSKDEYDLSNKELDKGRKSTVDLRKKSFKEDKFAGTKYSKDEISEYFLRGVNTKTQIALRSLKADDPYKFQSDSNIKNMIRLMSEELKKAGRNPKDFAHFEQARVDNRRMKIGLEADTPWATKLEQFLDIGKKVGSTIGNIIGKMYYGSEETKTGDVTDDMPEPEITFTEKDFPKELQLKEPPKVEEKKITPSTMEHKIVNMADKQLSNIKPLEPLKVVEPKLELPKLQMKPLIVEKKSGARDEEAHPEASVTKDFSKEALNMLKNIIDILSDGFGSNKTSVETTKSGERVKDGDIDVSVNITEQKSDLSLAKLIAEKIRAKRAALT